MALSDSLAATIKGEVDVTPETLEAASKDASLFRVVPAVVVRPDGVGDVEALVKLASEENKRGGNVSLTARAAGTDMSGGPLTESIVVDMLAHFNRVLEVGRDYAVVEPGVYFRDFDKETKKKNLELPSYTASREICTVGGMVANNSGGEKNLKYGKTARYVQELDVVLSDGKVHTLKNLEGDDLKKKLKEIGFEGDLYRAISELVSTNQEIIQKHAPHVEKNSSGFALWDIGDGKNKLDLARLMVGSQGSIGIITKIRFGLVHPKPYSAMTVMFVRDIAELGPLVPKVLEYKPDSFESYDDNTFKLAVKYFPEFALQMKTGIFGLGVAFLPEMWLLATGGVPKLVLMAEFCSDSQQEATDMAEKLATEIRKSNRNISVRVAKDERSARKYWTVRRESFNLLRKKVRGQRTAPFIDDFVVPPKTLSDFLPKLKKILDQYALTYTVAGHVGDGNFHIIPLIDPNDPQMTEIIGELEKKVYDLVLSFQGSLSGEHNDGLVRTPFVRQMFGPEMYALFEKTEKIFDPLDIFNPGKKVGTTFAEEASKLDFPHHA